LFEFVPEIENQERTSVRTRRKRFSF
jgi:hypothetical protein